MCRITLSYLFWITVRNGHTKFIHFDTVFYTYFRLARRKLISFYLSLKRLPEKAAEKKAKLAIRPWEPKPLFSFVLSVQKWLSLGALNSFFSCNALVYIKYQKKSSKFFEDFLSLHQHMQGSCESPTILVTTGKQTALNVNGRPSTSKKIEPHSKKF